MKVRNTEENKRYYQIWAEGYLVSGMEGKPIKAQFLGEFMATSFIDAVEKYKEAICIPDRKLISITDSGASFWGCRLFDNEADARKSFG